MEERHHGENQIARHKAERVAAQAAKACSSVERWLYSTPFGLPVVPEV